MAAAAAKSHRLAVRFSLVVSSDGQSSHAHCQGAGTVNDGIICSVEGTAGCRTGGDGIAAYRCRSCAAVTADGQCDRPDGLTILQSARGKLSAAAAEGYRLIVGFTLVVSGYR